MSTAEYTAFGQLRNLSASIARAELESRHRVYVEAVRRESAEYGGDLDAIRLATASLLPGNARPWPQLFSALFDVEHVREKLILSLRLASSAARSSAENAGEQFDYHREHWLFQGSAFLDRVNNLAVKAIRLLLRPIDRDWSAFQQELTSGFKCDVRDKFAQVRDPLAHELGAGVDALMPYWLPLLALPSTTIEFDALFRSIATSARDARTRRNLAELARSMERHTAFILAESERVARRLLDRVTAAN